MRNFLKVSLYIVSVHALSLFASYQYGSIPTHDADAFTELAHSKPVYNHVGKIHCPEDQGKHWQSVVFYRGKTCFGDASLINGIPYTISFEANGGNSKIYTVTSVHKIPNANFSVLILDQQVEGFGMTPVRYHASFNDEIFFERKHPPLTYVGNSNTNSADQWFYTCDGPRRAIKSDTKAYSTQNGYEILGLPLGEFFDGTKNRSLDQNESHIDFGMIGGGVFNNEGELISIITRPTYSLREMSWRNLFYLGFACSFNWLSMKLCCSSYPVLNISFSIPGAQPHSAALGTFEREIHKIRETRDNTVTSTCTVP